MADVEKVTEPGSAELAGKPTLARRGGLVATWLEWVQRHIIERLQ
jgi:hypothetical protein